MQAKRLQPSAEDAPPPVKQNIAWASTIKGHHVAIRTKIDACKGDVGEAWRATLEDAAALETYANAMHDLATTHWEPSAVSAAATDGSAAEASRDTRRYDDRLGYVAGAVRRFLVGATEADRAVGFEPGPPGIAAKAIKAARVAHFAQRGCVMPAEEVQRFLDEWMRAQVLPEDSVRATVNVLDVGSCYNPLRCRFAAEGQLLMSRGVTALLRVVGVDLAPHSTAVDVVRCDWSREDLFPSVADKSMATSRFLETSVSDATPHPWYSALLRPSADPFACRVQSASFHVVTFILLLSYLPTSALRARCVENAHRALRMHGLLVIVSTRTQGSRKCEWTAAWIAAVERVGFVRVNKDVKAKIVGLTFQKVIETTSSLIGTPEESMFTVIADEV